MLPGTGRAAVPGDTTVPLGFVVAPGRPLLQHLPLERSFHLTTAAGTTVDDRIAVLNLSAVSPLTLTLRALDGMTPPVGAGITFSENLPQRQIGRWAHLDTTRVMVLPRQYVVVPLRLAVPATARPGEYEGAISATSQQAVTVAAGGRRYLIHGTRRCLVFLRVSGAATAGLAIVGARLASGASPAPLLAVSLRNTGSVTAQPLSTRITVGHAHRTATVQAAIGTVSGGASTVVYLPLQGRMAPGAYPVSIVLTYLAHTSATGPVQRLRAAWHGAVVVPRP